MKRFPDEEDAELIKASRWPYERDIRVESRCSVTQVIRPKLYLKRTEMELVLDKEIEWDDRVKLLSLETKEDYKSFMLELCQNSRMDQKKFYFQLRNFINQSI